MDMITKDVTPKVILDTNMVYYICGLSSSNQISISKVLAYLEANQGKMEFATSSVSFYELLVRYQKRARLIRQICSTLRNYHIRIYNDPYLPINFTPPYDFTKIRQQELASKISEFLPRKVDVESRFAAVILLVLLLSEISFEAYPTGELNSKTFPILTAVANISQQVTVTCLNRVYQNAYQQKDAENYIRDDFQRLLAMLLPLGVTVCKKCADIKETDDIVEFYDAISKDEMTREIEAIERALAHKHASTQYVFKRAIAYGKKIGDKTLKDLLQHIWDTTANAPIANESLKEYIYETVKGTLLQGGSFWKNDIIDAMILGNMSQNDYLITCDKKMLNHMDQYQKDHVEYANSLKLVQGFQR